MVKRVKCQIWDYIRGYSIVLVPAGEQSHFHFAGTTFHSSCSCIVGRLTIGYAISSLSGTVFSFLEFTVLHSVTMAPEMHKWISFQIIFQIILFLITWKHGRVEFGNTYKKFSEQASQLQAMWTIICWKFRCMQMLVILFSIGTLGLEVFSWVWCFVPQTYLNLLIGSG